MSALAQCGPRLYQLASDEQDNSLSMLAWYLPSQALQRSKDKDNTTVGALHEVQCFPALGSFPEGVIRMEADPCSQQSLLIASAHPEKRLINTKIVTQTKNKED